MNERDYLAELRERRQRRAAEEGSPVTNPDSRIDDVTEDFIENGASALGFADSAPRDSLTGLVIGAAIEVHREMGPGLLEYVYQKCLERELRRQHAPTFQPQCRLPLIYKGEVLDEELVMDFYFPDRLVVEIKAVTDLHPVHECQLLTYLRLSRTRVGLLINFTVPVLKDGVRRMVL